jgi:hypothetical protein
MIGIAIPFHLKGKRHNYAYAKSFRHYAKSGHLIHLCGSEGNLSKAFCKPFISENVRYVEVPQGPVCLTSCGNNVIRDKFNDSLMTLPRSCEWKCLVGADDLVDLNIFNVLLQTFRPQACMSGVSMDSPLYLVYGRKRARISLKYGVNYRLSPGINAFNKAAMNLCKNKPYQLSGCETGAEKLFSEIGMLIPIPGYVVSIKGADVLNGYEKLVKVHGGIVLTKIDNQIIDKVLDL